MLRPHIITICCFVFLLGLVGCRPISTSQSLSPSVSDGAMGEKAPLMVFCAAGIRLPVEEVAKKYEIEYGRKVQIDYGSSGELEGRLEIDRRSGKSRCDLYIPADESFASRTRQKQLTLESIPLAKFRLVLAVRPDSGLSFDSVDELLAGNHDFVVCDPKAGVGKKTMTALRKSGHWDAVNAQKKVSFPRVPEAANAIKTSGDVEAGFIWDTTAIQFGLKGLIPPEIADATSTVTVNVSALSKRPTDALHFARYLGSTDKGQPSFEKFGFEPAATDVWSDPPELIVYCGGVNRNAIDKTLREFEKREGVIVREQYAGCGTLVTGINAIASGASNKGMPDAFMTCDASYLTKVENLFQTPMDVSSTRVVMLVRKGNPKGLKTIADLARPGVAIGTTNPKMSTLGDISWQLFELEGIKDKLEAQKSVMVMTPTAHELIMQMTGHDKLDVALVYEANCQNLSDDFEIIPVDHKRAVAVQNIATSQQTLYPALISRLKQTLTSVTSQKRFELNGFQWQVQPNK